MNKQAEIMRDIIKTINASKTYTLDMSKINTLDDVKKVLQGLDIQITVTEGTTNDRYEKLKYYLKEF